jgi:tetratricopeptide (TPR) repeat protein
MMALWIVLAIICIIIRAYVSYYRAWGPGNWPEIMASGISSLGLLALNVIGYGIFGVLGYKIQARPGAIISVIIYYFWGFLWHQGGARAHEASLYFYNHLSRDIKKWIFKGNLLSGKGNYKEANDSYDNALQLMTNAPANLYYKACIYALKKDKENTMNYLKEAFRQSRYKPIIVNRDFYSFRNDEEFQTFLNNISKEFEKA